MSNSPRNGPELAKSVSVDDRHVSATWGPGEVSTINEPLGAFPIWSSTLAVLADSDPFRGLLLTVFGP